METIWQTLAELGTHAGMKILYAALLLLAGLWIIKWLRRVLHKGKLFNTLPASYKSFLSSLFSIVLYVMLLITIALLLGVPAASFVTLLASAGVTVGLALQGSLSNVAGGLMILFFHPFRVGDYIEAAGHAGTVQEITVFYTVLCSVDNKQITLPNGSLANGSVINYSAMPQRRVEVAFTLPYAVDRAQVQAWMLEAGKAHALTLDMPEPFCRFTAYGDSGMTCTLRVWVKASDYWTVYFDLLDSVKARLDAAGIELPYPQMDVHVYPTEKQ